MKFATKDLIEKSAVVRSNVAFSAPSHYLDQCWPSSLPHMCSTKGDGLNGYVHEMFVTNHANCTTKGSQWENVVNMTTFLFQWMTFYPLTRRSSCSWGSAGSWRSFCSGRPSCPRRSSGTWRSTRPWWAPGSGRSSRSWRIKIVQWNFAIKIISRTGLEWEMDSRAASDDLIWRDCATEPRLWGSWGLHGAHLGPTGPRWAPCWPHEPCYQGNGANSVFPWNSLGLFNGVRSHFSKAPMPTDWHVVVGPALGRLCRHRSRVSPDLSYHGTFSGG